jgi:hypothetical protein
MASKDTNKTIITLAVVAIAVFFVWKKWGGTTAKAATNPYVGGDNGGGDYYPPGYGDGTTDNSSLANQFLQALQNLITGKSSGNGGSGGGQPASASGGKRSNSVTEPVQVESGGDITKDFNTAESNLWGSLTPAETTLENSAQQTLNDQTMEDLSNQASNSNMVPDYYGPVVNNFAYQDQGLQDPGVTATLADFGPTPVVLGPDSGGGGDPGAVGDVGGYGGGDTGGGGAGGDW